MYKAEYLYTHNYVTAAW